MRKEKLTLGAIKQDLMKILNSQVSSKADWRFSYIVPITFLAFLSSAFLKNIFIGLLIFSVSVYHFVRFVIEFKEYRSKKAVIVSMIERGEISISIKRFSHIANETIYEPHHGWKITTLRRMFVRSHAKKTITVYHFDGGKSWRLPRVDKHYSWRKDFYISSKGLENISITGDEFYFISLQAHHDIAYVYPCKNFELDVTLKDNIPLV